MAEAANMAVDGATLTHRAYQVLRQDILAGALAAGARLRIDALKTRYGIGPTPLREALSRLAADGFVVAEENKGFRIPPMSLAELRDVTDQRKLIECTGLERAVARMDDQFEAGVLAAYHLLSRLDDQLADGDASVLAEWEARHRAFHQALITGARSPWLAKFQEILYDQADRYRRLYLPRARVSRQVIADHKAILDATLARDAVQASALLSRHIERVFEVASRSEVFHGQSLD